MSGRGFLKSRLAQMAVSQKNLDEKTELLVKPEEVKLEKSKEPESKQILEVQKGISEVPIVSTENVVDEPKPLPVARGRRAMLAAHYFAQESGSQGLGDIITSQFSKLELGNSKESLTVPPVCKIEDISKLPEHVTQPISIVTSREEKSPVMNRVLQKSSKDNFQITQLSSNYIKIELEENKGIYEYRVDFDPSIDARAARFFLLNCYRDLFPVKTFDGTSLYIPTMLPQNITKLKGKLRDGSEVAMTISFKRKSSLHECIHFYNVFLRSIMNLLGLVEFGRSFFDADKKICVPDLKLEVWPGYIATINEFEDGLYMCCEMSHRVLRVESVLELMTEIGKQSKNNNGDSKQELMAAFCGSTVITHYNHKTYKIDDIDFSISPRSKFVQHGTEISYIDYYKKMYNIDIKNQNQPMLISNMKKSDLKKSVAQEFDICCLVPELCNLTGLTDTMKSDFKLMKVLHTHTLITPEVRQKGIIDFVNRINDHEIANKKFKDWGLVMCPIPVRLEGPVYKRETIVLGNNIRVQVGVNMDWGNDVARNAMFAAANLLNWAILYNPRDELTAKSFCKQLAMCGKPLGMVIKPPKPVRVQGTNPEVFVSAINNTIRSSTQLQIIIIIFPNQREDRYNAVKRICCVEFGIPSQVIISRTLSKQDRLQSITQKIALQINCKLGGACWAVDIPLKLTMVIGIDVYHDKGNQMNSVVGFVASMNRTFTEWYSVADIQKSTYQELMVSMQNAFHKVANQFKVKNGSLPEKIIVYRDGLSDGELKVVEEVEIHDLEKSFKCFFGNYSPMITYIIIQKRINTRVFQFLNNKYSNPISGTVIDSTVTRRNYFDFFLVSQYVRQGTVNPTHYIVLKNGCNLSTENVQRLSYKLCHLYYNWCGTVKVPAPVQYAHKLAYLIGQNVRQMPNEQLCNTLFFL